MKRIFFRIGSLSLAVWVFWITYANISSGQIQSKFGGYLTVAEHPRRFWFSVVVGIFFSVLFFVAAFLKGDEKDWKLLLLELKNYAA